MQQFPIENLLPYSNNILMKSVQLKVRVLRLLCFILYESLEAIKHFYFEKDLLYFDPHVGENLCQIRACEVLHLAIEYANNEEQVRAKKSQEYADLLSLFLRIKQYLQGMQRVERSRRETQRQFIRNDETLTAYLKSIDCDIELNDDTAYLMQAHFLTKFRVFNEFANAVIDYPALNEYIGISKNIARKLIHIYQIQVANRSANFVLQRIDHAHTDLLDEKISNMLIFADDDARKVLPAYVVMDVLLGFLLEMRYNLIFVVKRTYSDLTTALVPTCFKVSHTGQYQYAELSELNPNEPCFTLHGVELSRSAKICSDLEYQTYLIQSGPIEIIMSNMAAHPQFSGKKLVSLKENPFIQLMSCGDSELAQKATTIETVYTNYREQAEVIGTSSNNPSLFFIRHIFCSTPAQQVELIDANLFYNSFRHDKVTNIQVAEPEPLVA